MGHKRRAVNGQDSDFSSRTASTKKSRTLVTPQAVSQSSFPTNRYSRDVQGDELSRHEVNPESEEIEEEEEMEEQEPETEEEEDGAMPLVVFQCSTCRSIFGDSYAFVCSTEQLWLVTLSHVTNVAQAPEVQTAHDGADAGSSYYELLCQNCQAVLGRRYLTTPVALDAIRDLFSFSTEAITSYTLGEPMQNQQENAQATAACHAAMQKLAVDRDEIVRLREEMEKVKGLMVTVDDRLAQLEGGEVEFEEETARDQDAKA